MAQVEPKKKMSKGCLIALIIGIVVVVMVIAAAVTCYLKRDDVAKFGAATILGGIKTMVAESPPAGVDTTRFNGVVDAFIDRLNAEPLDQEKFAGFFSGLQTIPTDQKVDSVEAQMLLDDMFEYFPELEDLYPVEEEVEPTEVTDSI